MQGTEPPDGYVPNKEDCNDTDPSINPLAEEVCDDGIDNNCNGLIDEDCELEPVLTPALENASSTPEF